MVKQGQSLKLSFCLSICYSSLVCLYNFRKKGLFLGGGQNVISWGAQGGHLPPPPACMLKKALIQLVFRKSVNGTASLICIYSVTQRLESEPNHNAPRFKVWREEFSRWQWNNILVRRLDRNKVSHWCKPWMFCNNPNVEFPRWYKIKCVSFYISFNCMPTIANNDPVANLSRSVTKLSRTTWNLLTSCS